MDDELGKRSVVAKAILSKINMAITHLSWAPTSMLFLIEVRLAALKKLNHSNRTINRIRIRIQIKIKTNKTKIKTKAKTITAK